jgi:adenine/guanine/hypoxanthine permease
MLYRVRGSILIGIFLTSIISWPRSTPVTYFPHTPEGDALFDFFKQVVAFHDINAISKAITVSLYRRFLVAAS